MLDFIFTLVLLNLLWTAWTLYDVMRIRQFLEHGHALSREGTPGDSKPTTERWP
jgi:hypothetical protein